MNVSTKKRYNGSEFSFGEVMKSNGISFLKILDLIAMQEILTITAPQTPLSLKALSTMSAKHHIHQLAKDQKKVELPFPFKSLRPLFPSAHVIYLLKPRQKRNIKTLSTPHRHHCSEHSNKIMQDSQDIDNKTNLLNQNQPA